MLVSDLYEDCLEILGKCTQATVFSRLTDAIQILSNKGNFDLLVGWVDICAGLDCRTVTLPRDIDVPLAVNIGGHPRYFRNKWYEFHLNGSGSFSETPWTWDDRGDTPIIMDIIQASNLIAVAELKTDTGALLRVFGYDQTGEWIRTQNPDGTWSDGFLVPINLSSDFPMGIIVPDPNRVFARNFTTVPITELVSATPHQLVTGALVTLSLITPPLPTPLINGAAYYVGDIDDESVSLFATQSGAQTNTGAIIITSATNASQISLTDRRVVAVQTKFNSATAHGMITGAPITFTGAPLPVPIQAGVTYYANVIDANNFTAHASLSDALSDTNPIDVSTPGAGVVVDASQTLNPITELNFNTAHNFLQGDQVQVQNLGGSLPEPLLPGVDYFVRFLTSRSITLHNNLSDATTGANPIVLLSSGAGSSSVVKTLAASANVGTSNNITAIGHNLTIETSFPILTTVSRARASNVATIIVATPHGYSSGDYVTVKTVGGTGYNTATNTNALITVVDTLTFTYSNIGANEATAADVAGRIQKVPATGDFVQFVTTGIFPAPLSQGTVYRAEPPMSGDTFTVYTTGIQPVEILQPGTGELSLVISRVFTVGFNSDWQTNATELPTGTPIKISSTGTLPGTNPVINLVTTYFVRKIDDNTIEVFDTLANANDTAVRQSFSRARNTNTATIVTAANHGFITGDFVDISGLEASDNGVLQTADVNAGGAGYVDGENVTLVDGGGFTASAQISVTAGAITFFRILNGGSGFTAADTGTVVGGSGAAGTWKNGTIANSVAIASSPYNVQRIQINVTGLNSFTYTNVGLNEPTTGDIGGVIIRSDIKVLTGGVGDISLVLERAVTAQVFSSLMRIDSAQFLLDDATIRFETDGTLPAPLAVLTDYRLHIVNGFLEIVDTLENQIILTNIGSGNHSMVITRVFGVVLPTSYEVVSNNYNDGDQVTLQTTGTLPNPLALLTNYYLRRINDDEVEIYDTAAHAINLVSTVGRIVATNTGTGVHSIIQIVANFLVQRITRVTKTASNGFIKLYAWDNGRTTTLTIIGNYFPDETEPIYRRFRTQLNCTWVRIRYRNRLFSIKSMEDFIPLKSRMAVLMMLRALEMYRAEFNERAESFEKLAEKFMNEDQNMQEGPDQVQIQFNSDIWTNPYEEGMDNGRGYF